MGNTGGEATDDFQPVRVAKLFDRDKAGGRLLLDFGMGIGELCAHLVHAFGKVRQFVARSQMDCAGKVADRDSPRFVD